VRLLHGLAKIHASFDDPNLVSRAGLVPVMALAQRAGLAALAGEHVAIAGRCGVNAQLKVACLVAGMVAGADRIDDLDVLRYGAMPALFGGIRAPSTLGSFLRSFSWGNARQAEQVSRELLAELARRTPLLPGKDVVAFIDIDSMQKRVYGRKKQGAAFGHTKIQGKGVLVRGLNALAATISTPLAAPVIAATRLRGGNAGSARGAASFAAESVSTARSTGCAGTLVVRAGLGVLLRGVHRTCPRARFPRTRPGSPAPPSRTTCCAPPDRWPASPTPRPGVPRCAVTSSTSPPAPPATAAGTSPCTCPKDGTASRTG